MSKSRSIAIRLTALYSIAYDAEFVEGSSSSLCARGLLEHDLNITDGVFIPNRFQRNVRKTKCMQVPDHLLSKIVFDSVGLVLGPVLLECVEELASGSEIHPKGLLYNDAVLAGFCITLLLEVLRNGDDDAGWQCEVEHPIASVLVYVLGFDLLECIVKEFESF